MTPYRRRPSVLRDVWSLVWSIAYVALYLVIALATLAWSLVFGRWREGRW